VAHRRHLGSIPQFQHRDSPFDKVQGRLAGATEYLTKPFEAEQPIAVVGKFAPPDRNAAGRSLNHRLHILDLSKNKTFARSGFQSPPHSIAYVTYTNKSGFDIFTVNKAKVVLIKLNFLRAIAKL